MTKEKRDAHSAVKEKKDTATETAVKPEISGKQAGEEESIDRVRDILFGAQMRQNEQKFIHLAELLQKEIASLREETRKHLDSLENYAKKGLESLANQLKTEQIERTESVEELSQKINDKNKHLEKKIGQMEEKATKGHRDLHEQILQQSKDLRNEIREKHEEISVILDKSVRELRDEKTDRIGLANLFTEVAMRLKEEFKIPDVE